MPPERPPIPVPSRQDAATSAGSMPKRRDIESRGSHRDLQCVHGVHAPVPRQARTVMTEGPKPKDPCEASYDRGPNAASECKAT